MFMPVSILIIENEKLVCEALSDILDLGGHKSIVACDGEEGVDVFRANPSQIDLVILDMRLPGLLGGADVLGELQALRPDMRVIISSGDDRKKLTSQFGTHDHVFFLPKPYDVEDVLTTVSHALSV
jgi:DNA-binding NtrC family response regulator